MGFPIDTVAMKNNTYRIHEHRFEENDLREMSQLWNNMVRSNIDNLPESGLKAAFESPEVAPINKITLTK